MAKIPLWRWAVTHLPHSKLYELERTLATQTEDALLPWNSGARTILSEYLALTAEVGKLCAEGRLSGYYDGRQPEQLVWVPPGEWFRVRVWLLESRLHYRNDEYVSLMVDDPVLDQLLPPPGTGRGRGRPSRTR